MKKSQFIAAALAGVCFASLAFAFPQKESTGKSAAPALKIVPTKVVGVTGLSPAFAGVVVNVEFTLGPTGQPRDIRVLWVSDPVFKRQLVQAFSQWRFDGPVHEANAANQRFILPLEIIPET